MSRWTSQTEWISYWCLVMVAAGAVCLAGRPNHAEIKLVPSHPVEVERASAGGPEIPFTASRPVDVKRAQTLAADVLGAAQLTLELLAPLVRDASDAASEATPAAKSGARVATTRVDDETATDSTPDPAPSSAPAVEPLTPELIALRDKVRRVLAMYYPRHQNARDNNAWEMMHAIIAYGVDTQIYKNGPGGEKVNAIGWLCFNNPCAGDRMMFVNGDKLEARRGVGVQGHHGQFLAILAQSHLKADYPLFVSGKQFTLADLIEHEKQNCFAGDELTFKLIALMHYLDSDATWTSRDGQPWSIQRLIKEELAQPIRGAACGGTHRLMGFSYAVNKRIQRGQPVVGEFARAQTFINDYHRYTFSLQNPDGSFSTEWFVRKGNDPSIDRRLKTSGHILEWIGFSLSNEQLRDPRMIKAVNYVATILEQNDRHTWEIGPLGHGLHALALYDTRVFKPADPPHPQTIVETSSDELSGPPIEARYPTESTR